MTRKAVDECLHFGKIYSNDVNGKELFQEVLDCRLLIKCVPVTSAKRQATPTY